MSVLERLAEGRVAIQSDDQMEQFLSADKVADQAVEETLVLENICRITPYAGSFMYTNICKNR